MKARGDIESVNLSTGQRYRRVSGDGENRLLPEMLQPFLDEMENVTIPQIVADRLRREKLWRKYVRDNPWL